MHIKIIPYNEEIVTKIKQMNFIQWNRTEKYIIIKKNNFKKFYMNIIKCFNFKLCSYYDYFKLFRQKIMENDSKSLKGNFSVTTNITINTEYLNELSHNVDSSYYEGRELVNKIKLVGAANNYYKEVIYNKIK
ncbi:conserved Plasmodium protein, unknown function [Plasmodium gaboni]|uniref:Uncharacterized protein n=1 Tax=Plasmodium gaboni TaxID=647221 RepID=A0ABY0KVY1_9APIC|nr:conserved Plasmodium protein, unknown function [Plasmodium gaboni]